MVEDIEPVPHVAAVAVDGQGLAVQRVQDHQRDQLLRELEGAVVVRAVRDQGGQLVGLVPGAHQVVGPGLGGGVGRVRGVRRRLREGPGRAQGAVDLVRRDVQEPEGLVPALGQGVPRRLEQLVGAEDVGADEGPRVVDRSVHVGLGGEIHDRVGPVVPEEVPHRQPVGDVGLDEREARVLAHRVEAREVSGVGQLVHDDQPVLGRLQRVADEVRADEARPPGHQQRRHFQARTVARSFDTPGKRFS